jgi:uncharacterized protein YciI
MDLFVYQLKLKSQFIDPTTWGPDVHSAFKAHAEFLESSIKKGTALIVGRSDTLPKDNFGIVIFAATDLVTATEFTKQDPIIQHGVMTAETYPFKLFHAAAAVTKWQLW